MTDLRQISIYGKGGVGKSTITNNLAIRLSEINHRVMLVGCSPKTDSTYLLLGRRCEPTILDNIRLKGTSLSIINECIQVGYHGVFCVEAGGPETATGCAGRGVYYALKLIKEFGLIEKNSIDFVIYDVIADVVCGGFSQPMKIGFSSAIYIVTTSELMSLYSANNICNAILAINSLTNSQARIGGLINNQFSQPKQKDMVEDFANRLKIPLLAHIPKSDLVQEAESKKGTVLQYYPDSEISSSLRKMADKIYQSTGVLPQPLDPKESIEFISNLVNHYQNKTIPSIQIDRNIERKPLQPFQSKSNSIYLENKSDENRNEQLFDQNNRRIAIYGKAGIGKSTISANLSVALSGFGQTVLQVGCDPKRDSVVLLTHKMIPTILEVFSKFEAEENTTEPQLEDILQVGFNNVYCIESGGPIPGIGCAGKGIVTALQFIEEKNLYQKYGISFSIYDVLGDVVCSGFGQPIRSGYCKEIYLITNGELLSLFATNNILRAVKKLHSEGVNVGVGGIIDNMSGIPNEKGIVEEFSSRVGIPVVAHIPRSQYVINSEAKGKTVLEAFPDSDQANCYLELAKKILKNNKTYIPRPFNSIDDIFEILK